MVARPCTSAAPIALQLQRREPFRIPWRKPVVTAFLVALALAFAQRAPAPGVPSSVGSQGGPPVHHGS